MSTNTYIPNILTDYLMQGMIPSADVDWDDDSNCMECYGNLNSMVGFNHSDETKQKISESLKGRNNSPQHNLRISAAKTGVARPTWVIEKMRQANLGRPLSTAHKKKLSEARTGDKNCWYGVPMSEERKTKFRAGSEKIHKCVHCGKESNKGNITRWHNDNCKNKLKL